MKMQKLHTEVINFDKAEPDTWPNIIKYVLTAGRFGSLFKPKNTSATLWRAHTDVRCRCVTVKVTEEEI